MQVIFLIISMHHLPLTSIATDASSAPPGFLALIVYTPSSSNMMLLIVRASLFGEKEKREFCVRVLMLPPEAEWNIQVMSSGTTSGWALLTVKRMVKVSPHNCMLLAAVTAATCGATRNKQ